LAATVNVLLVDDMDDNLTALEAVLSPLRHTLIRARSGAEAMKAVMKNDFAVILMDVIMPYMDGFEAAAHIKRLDQTKGIPIIFLTAAGVEAGHAMRGYQAGAVDFITKPFDPWILRAKVNVFVDLYRKKHQFAQLMTSFADRLAAVEDHVKNDPVLDELTLDIEEMRGSLELMATELHADRE
jgi:CheY-like chemotaxis protein